VFAGGAISSYIHRDINLGSIDLQFQQLLTQFIRAYLRIHLSISNRGHLPVRFEVPTYFHAYIQGKFHYTNVLTVVRMPSIFCVLLPYEKQIKGTHTLDNRSVLFNSGLSWSKITCLLNKYFILKVNRKHYIYESRRCYLFRSYFKVLIKPKINGTSFQYFLMQKNPIKLYLNLELTISEIYVLTLPEYHFPATYMHMDLKFSELLISVYFLYFLKITSVYIF
jgi:hypothetical protein